MLRANMMSPDRRPNGRPNVDRDTECRPVSEYDPFKTLDPDTCIVTFVRHPFDHFVSAYNEAEHRWGELARGRRGDTMEPGDYAPLNRNGVGTQDRALAFIGAVLELKWMGDPLTYKNARDPVDPKHGDRPPLHHPFKSLMAGPIIKADSPWSHNVAFAHVLPQSSAVTRMRPDFVGRLESVEADWEMMQKVCNITIGELNQGKGQHATSKDPEGSARAMRELIETNTYVQLVLCLLYRNDFVAFGYSFPPACNILFQEDGEDENV